jgi:YggT family protein
MDVILGPLFWLITTVLELAIWLLIIGAVLSWLVAFNVINTRNRFVAMLGDFVCRVTEPMLRPIRRVLPVIGGVDLSPLVAILLLLFVQQVLLNLRYSLGT